ncbi:MAG: hypothetical protein RMK29_06095 [Myxococcales bacterium]|nr:hypothetical protein [Myxococcota bacterium]MDW8281262.1 hypothetical protein [Myxococcales bacterium]
MESRPPPVQVTLGGTTALLLMQLMRELGTEDGGGVISRALSLYDMVLRKQRGGQRVCLFDPATGAMSDLAI